MPSGGRVSGACPERQRSVARRTSRCSVALCLLGLLATWGAEAQPDLTKYVWQQATVKVPDNAKTRPVRRELVRAVTELLDAEQLAPMYVQLGIAGHEFFFDDSAEELHALSLAYPHLPKALQARVKTRCDALVREHPPWTPQAYYDLGEGTRRELFDVPERFTGGRDRGYEAPPAVAQLYAMWEYGRATGDWSWLDAAWPGVSQAYRQFGQSGWTLDPARGDLCMNRVIAGLIGFARLARQKGAPEAEEAAAEAAKQLAALIEHHKADAPRLQRLVVERVSGLDQFIGSGSPIWLRIRGHKHKIAKFLDVTPEVGRALHEHALGAATVFMQYVDDLMPGWYLANEETQVHYGENFVEYPDLSLGIFQAKAHLFREDADALQRYTDIPWCVGDLYYIEKLALVLDRMGETAWE